VVLADIASGEVDAADIFFLLGTLLGVLAGVLAFPVQVPAKVVMALIAFAVACVSFAFMLL
jgi:hypothetical protein